MRIARSAQRDRHLAVQREAGKRYYDRWKRMQADGRQSIIIGRHTDAEAWRKWRAYFSANSLWLPLDLMNDGRSRMTVPCLDPSELDEEPVEVQPDRRMKD